MPWPPTVPSGTRTNDTAEFDLHAADHNQTHTALNDIVTKIDTTGVPIVFNTDVRLRRTATKVLTFDDGTGAGAGASIALQSDARLTADKNGSGLTVVYAADRSPLAIQSYMGTSGTPSTAIGPQVRLVRRFNLKVTKVGTATTTDLSASVTGFTGNSGTPRGITAEDVGRAVAGTGIPGGTTILSRSSDTDFTLSANATASGTPTLTIGNAISDTVNQYELEGTSAISCQVKDAVGNQAQIQGGYFQADVSEATSFDSVAIAAIARQLGANSTRTATALYGDASRENVTAKAIVAELRCTNLTGVDGVYTSAGASDTTGLWLTAGGDADSAVAIALGEIGVTTLWRVGFAATGGSIVDQTFRDDSDAVTSLDINGSHTDGVDTVGATLSGGAVRMARAHYLTWRNNAGSADLGNVVGVDSSDRLALGTSSSVANVIMHRSVVLLDNVNLVPGTVTGTKICSSTTQKLGFWNATPVVQSAGIVNADGTLADITTKFNALIAKLETYGLLAVA